MHANETNRWNAHRRSMNVLVKGLIVVERLMFVSKPQCTVCVCTARTENNIIFVLFIFV